MSLGQGVKECKPLLLASGMMIAMTEQPGTGESQPPERTARQGRGGRQDRSPRAKRPDRAPRAERTERPLRTERTERAPRAERTERAPRTERPERPPRAERSGRAPQTERPRQRRRGEELEAALLEAAWDELVAVGFAKLTMESVAARARTGVAVLYRRWPNKDDLVLETINHYGKTHPVQIPDTGSLRGDMMAMLSGFSSGRIAFVTVVTAAFAGLLASSGLTPAEVREKLISDRPLSSTEVFVRAQRRGEIDLDQIPHSVLAMPWDLMRHDLLMTLKPLPEGRVLEIVDDLFLPLVRTYQASRSSRPVHD
jgi:AcrR family transcriptional regulator